MGESNVNPLGNISGLLRLKIIRGINLAVRDVNTSDPYVIVHLAKQKLKTRVIKKSINPEWNEDLTLCVTDPNEPVKLFVYDHDTFSKDDKMGDAEVDIKPFMEAIRMNLEGLPDGTVITKVKSNRQNCISEESCILWMDGKVSQNMFLRLRNVECGEVELQLQWIDVPCFKMGDAEVDIKPFMEAIRMNLEGLPDGTVITKVKSNRQNCISEESCILWMDGKVSQNMFLRLRNVECGEVELQLQWIDIPCFKVHR